MIPIIKECSDLEKKIDEVSLFSVSYLPRSLRGARRSDVSPDIDFCFFRLQIIDFIGIRQIKVWKSLERWIWCSSNSLILLRPARSGGAKTCKNLENPALPAVSTQEAPYSSSAEAACRIRGDERSTSCGLAAQGLRLIDLHRRRRRGPRFDNDAGVFIANRHGLVEPARHCTHRGLRYARCDYGTVRRSRSLGRRHVRRPSNNPRSEGLIGEASMRTTISSAAGFGISTLANDNSSSPLFLTRERSGAQSHCRCAF